MARKMDARDRELAKAEREQKPRPQLREPIVID